MLSAMQLPTFPHYAWAIGAFVTLFVSIGFAQQEGLPWWAFPLFYLPIVLVVVIAFRSRKPTALSAGVRR